MSFLFGKKKPGARDPGARDVGASPAASTAGASVTSGAPSSRQKDPYGPPSTAPAASSVTSNAGSFTGAAVASEPPRGGRTDMDVTSYGPPQRPGTSGGVPNGPTNSALNLYPWSQKPLNFTGPATPSGTANPFPRYGAAVNATSSKEGDIYVMGGLVNGSTVKGDLWIVEGGHAAANLSCYPVRTEAEGPGPRVGHASLLVGNAFIVFGGDTKQDENDPLDDTLYLLNTSTKQWSRALPPGPRPDGRYGHTLNILGSKLYVFGGQVDGHFFNDLVAFDLNQLASPANRWEMLVPDSLDSSAVGKQVPLGRTNHSMITWSDRLYLFGGTDGVQWFNDVWTFDPRTNAWSQLDCIGYIPQPREGHAAALVGDVMYVFGGRTQEGDDLGDLAAFRITSRRWYTFQNMGPSPSPRSGHSMTACDRQIVVLAGEPSSTVRDAHELSIAYVLDTTKIKYPNDQQIQSTPAGERVGATRRPSADRGGGRGPTTRDPQQRDHPEIRAVRSETHLGSPGGMNGPQAQAGALGTRMPRGAANSASQPNGAPALQGPAASMQQQQQAPMQQGYGARTNGSSNVSTPQPGSRSRTPTQGTQGQRYAGGAEMSRGGSIERQDPRGDATGANLEQQRGVPSRSLSPANDARVGAVQAPGRLGQPGYGQAIEQHQQPTPKSSNSALRGQNGPRSRTSVDNLAASQAGQRHQDPYALTTSNSQGSAGDLQPMSKTASRESHDVESHRRIEALTREIEQLRKSNAWYTTEVAMARKAGYSTGQNRMSLDGTARSLGEDDKPLIEALMTMRTELADVQKDFSQRADDAAKKVAEAEQQRDAAVREAVYAKAKLAAHGGTPRDSPSLGEESMRDRGGSDLERSNDNLRKLGAALAVQRELQSKLDAALEQHASEKRAREMAEDHANVAQKQFQDLDQSRNPGELESLRAELHEAQRVAREATAQRAEAQSRLQLLEVDKDDLSRQLDDSTTRGSHHESIVTALRDAVASSQEKHQLLEGRLQQEQEGRDVLQRKLQQLRTEHEERTGELEGVTKRLRESEEMADKHAAEAQRHRDLVVNGLDKISAKSGNDAATAAHERRIGLLQSQVAEANQLVTSSQQEAQRAAEKLRSAEERIAGLEAYQHQTSREHLGVRKQLQEASRNAQNYQSQHADLKQLHEKHLREHAALTVQHGALKDLLEERAASASRNRDSPTAEQTTRLRELETLLEESERAHAETKSAGEARDEASEREYREKIEQLEQDYQSAVSYVKGTEKMLKRMKDELTKSKTHNARLQADLEQAQQGRSGTTADADAPAGWETERQSLHREISDMQSQMTGAVAELERQLHDVHAARQSAENEREGMRRQHEQLSTQTNTLQSHLEKLQSDNAMLSRRALDAENKVSMLLDQVESSVDNYRRQSQIHHGSSNSRGGSLAHANGGNGNGAGTGFPTPGALGSGSGAVGGTGGALGSGPGHSASNSVGGDSMISSSPADRNSLALDHLASELETLRSQWEGTHRTYRLSHHDPPSLMDSTHSSNGGGGMGLAGGSLGLSSEGSGTSLLGGAGGGGSSSGPTTGGSLATGGSGLGSSATGNGSGGVGSFSSLGGLGGLGGGLGDSSGGASGELSSSLASWRKRLDAEEREREAAGR